MTTLNRTFLVLFLASFAMAGYAGDTENPEKTVPDQTTEKSDAKPSFETVDSNLDGVITPDEAEGSWLAAKFADVDANEDGLINRNEYDTAMS